jgi:hypothetical protein
MCVNFCQNFRFLHEEAYYVCPEFSEEKAAFIFKATDVTVVETRNCVHCIRGNKDVQQPGLQQGEWEYFAKLWLAKIPATFRYKRHISSSQPLQHANEPNSLILKTGETPTPKRLSKLIILNGVRTQKTITGTTPSAKT